jgi:glycosyltransferase involved in cell wall biosynthesis
MRDTPADLTTVVIPAYNAAATIDRTLATVRAQTHQALEIIVVDDGSTDATADIVRQHLQADARVRLIQQANAGVAAARNAAIAAGQGAFIAPIDADDLWHPRKIEKQLAAMHQGGPRVCLVNTGLALIDTDDRVLALLGSEVHTGDALRPLCEGSFLGCGSNPLMRAVPVRDVGGYDPSLRRQAAEGCEDFQLYLALAQRYDFAVVPEYLTGYRRLATSMSNDLMQMQRSFTLVAEQLLERRPDLRRHLRKGQANFLYSVFKRARDEGRRREARLLLGQYLRSFPYDAFKAFLFRPLCDAVRQRLGASPQPGASAVGRRFPLPD